MKTSHTRRNRAPVSYHRAYAAAVWYRGYDGMIYGMTDCDSVPSQAK